MALQYFLREQIKKKRKKKLSLALTIDSVGSQTNLRDWNKKPRALKVWLWTWLKQNNCAPSRLEYVDKSFFFKSSSISEPFQVPNMSFQNFENFVCTLVLWLFRVIVHCKDPKFARKFPWFITEETSYLTNKKQILVCKQKSRLTLKKFFEIWKINLHFFVLLYCVQF